MTTPGTHDAVAAPGPPGRAPRRALGWVVPALVVGAIVAIQGDQIADLLGSERVVLLQAVLAGVMLGAVYSLVALGLTIVFGALRIINFAHGSLLTVGMYCSWTLANGGMNPYLTAVITVPAMFALGWLLQVVLINRAMDRPVESQLLLTFGLAIVIQNALLVGYGADPRTVGLGGWLGTSIDVLGASVSVARLLAFAASVALAAAVYVLLDRTRAGTSIRAVAANPTGSALCGIDVRRVYALTFALGTACVGAAAVLVLPFTQLVPLSGETFTIIAFVVVVLGGLGNVPGALLGGLLIGLTQEVGGAVFPDQSDLLGVFLVFLLLLFLRPLGMFGRGD